MTIIHTQLPMLNGVTASQLFLPPIHQIACANNDYTVLDYLCHSFHHLDKAQIIKKFEDGLIFAKINNGFLPLSINDYYKDYQNTHIYYYRFIEHEVIVPFEHKIIYENDCFVVVDKPHFLTMSPSGNYVSQTLLTRLKQQLNNPDLTPIHRLDKDTAGLVLFCKNKKHRGAYQSLFADQKIKKHYHAIAKYDADLLFPMTLNLYMTRGNPFYTMMIQDNHKPNSCTHIEILEHNKNYAKYQLTPITGKLHQLRVHLNYLNIPIKNDAYYPTVRHKSMDDFSNPLQLLAKHIEFIDPICNRLYCFDSEQVLNLQDFDDD